MISRFAVQCTSERTIDTAIFVDAIANAQCALCPELEPPSGVSVSLSRNTAVGSIATYSCDNGDAPSGGERERVCQPDATWSGTASACVPEAQCKFTSTFAHSDHGHVWFWAYIDEAVSLDDISCYYHGGADRQIAIEDMSSYNGNGGHAFGTTPGWVHCPPWGHGNPGYVQQIVVSGTTIGWFREPSDLRAPLSAQEPGEICVGGAPIDCASLSTCGQACASDCPMAGLG
eukprot:SAG31_NODE_4631_length_3085_cov_1.693570_1_plen_231_part_00